MLCALGVNPAKVEAVPGRGCGGRQERAETAEGRWRGTVALTWAQTGDEGFSSVDFRKDPTGSQAKEERN